MRSNIPPFRLPADVLDEETGYIIDMGVDVRYETPVESMKALLAEGYDAVFVGTSQVYRHIDPVLFDRQCAEAGVVAEFGDVPEGVVRSAFWST